MSVTCITNNCQGSENCGIFIHPALLFVTRKFGFWLRLLHREPGFSLSPGKDLAVGSQKKLSQIWYSLRIQARFCVWTNEWLEGMQCLCKRVQCSFAPISGNLVEHRRWELLRFARSPPHIRIDACATHLGSMA